MLLPVQVEEPTAATEVHIAAADVPYVEGSCRGGPAFACVGRGVASIRLHVELLHFAMT